MRYFLHTLIAFVFVLPITLTFHPKETTVCQNSPGSDFKIEINTNDSSIRFCGLVVNIHNMTNVQKIIGKPNRIEIDTIETYYERFGTKGNPPAMTPIKLMNYYYIYDELGMMFYSENRMSSIKSPKMVYIQFGNKRTFTNTEKFPFLPRNSFSGTLEINGEPVSTIHKLVPYNVNYKTEDFKLFKVSCGPASIATVIDRIYSKTSDPYMLFYLDNESDQRLSYLTIY
ncbi:MAG: hypothetical protein KKA07_06330 [Bacteroidetes bacterium]|nr:hypothetical protein [Bacteroidota bacterium]MBU1718672.1 hypothetical protein [Bacteroidota bacterium]